MENFGPELTKKRVVSLLVAAALIVSLFVWQGTRRRDRKLPEPQEEVGLVISPFDSIFKEYADTLFDWKLLAAIACVESEFDTTKVSSRGAFGLMQVMPDTYRFMVRRLGLTDADSDSVSTSLNVYAAVQQLSDMNVMFSFINPNERLKFILGSYNCGHGHVFDAMRIARRDGVNRYVWSNIEEVIRTMDREEVYSDSICRYGRFNGAETIGFVRKVLSKYRKYCEMDTLSVDTLRVSPGA